MLSTLLDKLGGLLPRSFIIASFFPVVIFAISNGVMLYLFSASFRRAFEAYFALNATGQTTYGVGILIAISFVAYIFSTLNLYLLELLEGRHFAGFTSLQRRMVAEKQRQLDALQRNLERSQRQFFLLKTHADEWLDRLGKAYRAANESNVESKYSAESSVSTKIGKLKAERTRNVLITDLQFEGVVSAFEQEVKSYPIVAEGSKADDLENRRKLDEDHTSIRLLIDYSQRIAENNFIEAFNEKEFQYSRYKVNATSMGNIAESVPSYARSRYEMNLDSFWSRLQKSIQADEKFYLTMIDAKTQLDFLVSLFWLTTVFTVIWLASLLYVRTSWLAFVLVGVIGAGLAALWYEIAKQNYLAFADILRTSVDMFRFDLLKELHVKLPSSSDHERTIWKQLNYLIGHGDETETVRYFHQDRP
jgi:hypothetical protein